MLESRKYDKLDRFIYQEVTWQSKGLQKTGTIVALIPASHKIDDNPVVKKLRIKVRASTISHQSSGNDRFLIEVDRYNPSSPGTALSPSYYAPSVNMIIESMKWDIEY